MLKQPTWRMSEKPAGVLALSEGLPRCFAVNVQLVNFTDCSGVAQCLPAWLGKASGISWPAWEKQDVGN